MGELTNEVSPEDGHITHFVSGGPKNYAYKTASGKEICRVRGFSLDSAVNSGIINFTAIKYIVVTKETKSIRIVNPRKISRLSNKRKLYNRHEEKENKMFTQKDDY